jgi:hypothetical protein
MVALHLHVAGTKPIDIIELNQAQFFGFACGVDALETWLFVPMRREEALSLPTAIGVNDADRDSTSS